MTSASTVLVPDVESEMCLRVLGVLDLRVAGGRTVDITATKQQRLLTLLALRANTWVSIDQMVDAIWGASPPACAKGNVRTYVFELRRVLLPGEDGRSRIDARPGGYRLNVDRTEVDGLLFEDQVADGRTALADGRPEVARKCLSDALDLWRGEPYDALTVDYARTEATRLAELRWAARESLADAYLATDQAPEAVALLRSLTVEEPLRESAWCRLMAALQGCGRRAEALDAYRRARRVIVDELGVEPGPELRRRHREALQDTTQEPAPGPAKHGRPAKPRVKPAADPVRPAEPAVAEPDDGDSVPTATPPRAGRRVRRPDPRPLALAALAVAVASALLVVAVVVGGRETGTTTAEPPRRPIPGLPGAGAKPALLFGIGDEASVAGETDLAKGGSVKMLSTWYHEPADLARLSGWAHDVVPRAYAGGTALHLVVANWDQGQPVDTRYGQGCGRAYPLSPEFLEHMRTLATAFAGAADGPPLYVSMFNGVESYACVRGEYRANAANEAYFRALQDRFREVRTIFHQVAPNARVGIGWQGWMAGWDNPATGGGLSMFPNFADTMRVADFQSFSAVQPEGNVEDIRGMVGLLGQYGPVLLGYYEPTDANPATVDRDVRALLTDDSVAQLTRAGLFGWSFTTDRALRRSMPTYELVRQAVGRYARPAS